MHLIILMTRLPYTVFLSVLLIASHAKKPDNKSDPASNENEEEADFDKADLDKFLTNFGDKWYNKMLFYPSIWILGFSHNHDDYEHVPYTTIKKFDVSCDDPPSFGCILMLKLILKEDMAIFKKSAFLF